MIRKANLSDIDKIVEINKQLTQYHCEMAPKTFKMPDDKHFVDSIASSIESEKSEIFVFDDGIIKGYAKITESVRDLPIKISKKVCLIDELAVDGNHRHEGIGTKLINHIKSYVNDNDFDVLEICVRAENDNAYKLYEKMEFEPQLITMEIKLKMNSEEEK